MVKYEKEMLDVIDALSKSNLLDNCIITGSWAMYFYKIIFENFIPPVATTDLDIFFPSVKRIQKGNIVNRLLELDYLRDDDSFTGKTRFFSKEGFEIEFLTLPDKTMSSTVKIKSIGISAEALPKMEPIIWNYISVDFESYRVNIPSPSSFCLQKLLINKDRREDKRIKDIDAVRYVLDYVVASKKYKNEFIESFNAAPKKWRRIIKEAIVTNELIDLTV